MLTSEQREELNKQKTYFMLEYEQGKLAYCEAVSLYLAYWRELSAEQEAA